MDKATWAIRPIMILAALCGASLHANAEDFPSKPLTLVVPFSAGGPTDVSARLYAKALEKHLQQPVVVENKPGAGGTVGSYYVVRAKADGYTLLWGGTSTLAVAPNLYPSVTYDAKSFVPIGMAMRTPQMIAAHPQVPANNLDELLAIASTSDLSVGSAGNGSLGHLGLEYLQNTFKVQFTHVPYKGGAGAVSDLVGGQIDLTIDNATAVMPHIRAGKLKPIALAGSAPYPLAPAIPLVNAKAPGFEIYSWFGLVAHKDTPAPVVDRLIQAMSQASQEAEVQTALQTMGVEPGVKSVQEFAGIIAQDSSKWKGIIEKAKVQVK